MSDGLENEQLCGECGATLGSGQTICASCGWDSTTAVTRPARRSFSQIMMAGGWRLLAYGVLLLLLVVAAGRYKSFGPGPDLPTTLRWIVAGDGGHSAELVTIHRMYETAAAAVRYAIGELSVPEFEPGWGETLAPFETIRVRGWIPLLFYAANTDMVSSVVREPYEVREVDGWGRPYRVETRVLSRGVDWTADEQVLADLEAGLKATLFTIGEPDFEATGQLRLEMTSSGADGVLGSDDDLRMISYVPIGHVVHLSQSSREWQRRLEVAYELGRHHFRIEGSDHDLIDARILAEHRLDAFLG